MKRKFNRNQGMETRMGCNNLDLKFLLNVLSDFEIP